MSDPAEIRAEGRRLLADFYDLGPEDDGFRQDKLTDFFFDHADVLLADPQDAECPVRVSVATREGPKSYVCGRSLNPDRDVLRKVPVSPSVDPEEG